jgi:transcription initiation factor TFIIIB Brf1 subunit/transcription initiation factor TFIIB
VYLSSRGSNWQYLLVGRTEPCHKREKANESENRNWQCQRCGTVRNQTCAEQKNQTNEDPRSKRPGRAEPIHWNLLDTSITMHVGVGQTPDFGPIVEAMRAVMSRFIPLRTESRTRRT